MHLLVYTFQGTDSFLGIVLSTVDRMVFSKQIIAFAFERKDLSCVLEVTPSEKFESSVAMELDQLFSE